MLAMQVKRGDLAAVTTGDMGRDPACSLIGAMVIAGACCAVRFFAIRHCSYLYQMRSLLADALCLQMLNGAAL